MTLNGTSVPDERMTRKRALLAELELIRSQKAEVLRAIQQIAKKQKLGGVPSQAVALSHEAKMEAERRVHGDHQRKIWGLCTKILAELLKNSNTKLYFGEPVHRDKFPGYYEVIKEPRDLGTIKSQVESGFYPDIYALRDDVRLCFNNCRAYNPEGHPIRKIGDAASDAFEKKWVQKHVESEWEAEKQRHALAMERLEAEAKSLPEKIKEVDAELQELASKAAIRTTSQPPGPGRELTFEEKRRLSHLIGTLPGERLARVLEIIATAPTPPQGLQGEDDSEVELDIDAIDSDTLWKVQAYVELSLNELDGKAARPGSAVNAHVKAEQAQSEGQDGRSESDEVVGSKGNADSTGEHAPKSEEI
jgi:hypothetical protein